MKTIKRYKGVDYRAVYIAPNNQGHLNIHRPRYWDELLQKYVYGISNANNGANWLSFTYHYDVTGSVNHVLSITCEVPYNFVERAVDPNWMSIW